MRMKPTILIAGAVSIACALLVPREARAELPPVPPIVPRDHGWNTVSNITMMISAGTVFLMPRVYYSDPQSYAAWGSTGAGLGIFLVDTLKYSNGKFNVPYFIGNFAVPFTAALITSVGRGVDPGTTTEYENGGQIIAGALTGFASGALLGL